MKRRRRFATGGNVDTRDIQGMSEPSLISSLQRSDVPKFEGGALRSGAMSPQEEYKFLQQEMTKPGGVESKARGGVVRKPKRFQHGGMINVEGKGGPGGPSASSHKWSANMRGRDVVVKAKGGKVAKTSRERR
jgi:hypothetical protein